MTAPGKIPTATYRLQFNRNFTFDDATAIVGYLADLGISHVYASPYLKARAGSPHGYDIVDHNALNPEIGDPPAFARLVSALRDRQMGQILDIVPNHMGVGGSDNAWWLDVLEHGEASEYAEYFDIDWHPANPALQNKLLLPFLGDRYGAVLDRGELRLGFDPASGFQVEYFEHRFSIDPRTYPDIFPPQLLEQTVNAGSGAAYALRSVLTDCRALPRRVDPDPEQRRLRRQHSADCKRKLAAMWRDDAAFQALIDESLAKINGTSGKSRSFDRLHRLLEAQAWRLAYWQVATDEINYRRFFDINGLAGIRMEDRRVFVDTHGLVRKLVASGEVDGLRVDHPDGLYDPLQYFYDLQATIAESAGDAGAPIYVVAEKILAGHERLPASWPVAGTTGYDVAALINGLFIYLGSERRLTRLYRRFTGMETDFEELLYERKKFITRDTLSGELTVLANLLHRIAQADRGTRDFTYHGLLDALTEVVACFPVYRTYVRPDAVSDQDRRYVQWAVAKARKRSPSADTIIFDFVRSALLLEHCADCPSTLRGQTVQFAMRFQQYTAPVMAKGLEDTTFYIYNRLVSQNDVGFDPRGFGVSPAAFHHQNRQRLADWPHSMVATSTHDSKRSEDVRARINVISEIPEEWQRHLARWTRLNRARKRMVEDQLVPSRNDEYLFYQTLLGVWPLEPLDDAGLGRVRERVEAYMLKATREAKVYTSWINPNQAYEDGLCQFVRGLLQDSERGAFLADFIPFQSRVARFGLLNALSQVLLKLTVPGVPDIYQGNEIWTHCLVDPDNRQAIDYRQRRRLLDSLMEPRDELQRATLIDHLLARIEDGRAKLYVTWKTLQARRRYSALFARGDYTGLDASGERADHVCAFARHCDDTTAIVATGRWFARLMRDSADPPVGQVWGDTWIDAPANGGEDYRDVLTGKRVAAVQTDGRHRLSLRQLFADLPIALLVNE